MFPDVIQASTTSAYIPGLNFPLDSSVLALSSLNGASDILALIRTNFSMVDMARTTGLGFSGFRAPVEGI
jgi:hypothetical protein